MSSKVFGGKSYGGKGLDPSMAKRHRKAQSRHPICAASVRRFFNQNMHNRISATDAQVLGEGGQSVVDIYKMVHTWACTQALINAALHTELRNRSTITAEDMREGLKAAGMPVVYMQTHRRVAKLTPAKAAEDK